MRVVNIAVHQSDRKDPTDSQKELNRKIVADLYVLLMYPHTFMCSCTIIYGGEEVSRYITYYVMSLVFINSER